MTRAASVLITTFARLGMLERCLRSVVSQTIDDFECIVVNDHPPTSAQVDELVASLSDQRFTVLNNESNRGPAASRNRAVEAATSPILALLDDDDWWHPRFLDAHLRAHREHPEAALVYGGYERDASSLGLGTREVPASAPPADLFEAMLSGSFTFASTSILTVRRDALLAAGGYDDALRGFEDWDLACRLVRAGAAVALPEALTVYTEHAGYRVSADVDEEFARVAAKWSQFPQVHQFLDRRGAELEFNRSRAAAIAKQRARGWRHFGRFLRQARHYPEWPRAVALLVALNVFGPKLYARLAARSHR
jgi:glycosyltransferase involved in cell wall biosynthesis